MTRSLPETEIFVLLAERRRRLILEILQESTTLITVDELAQRIGTRECENPPSEPTQTIYLTLYHNHLPRLAEADVVKYNREKGTVNPGVNFDTLFRMLERADEMNLSWTGD